MTWCNRLMVKANGGQGNANNEIKPRLQDETSHRLNAQNWDCISGKTQFDSCAVIHSLLQEFALLARRSNGRDKLDTMVNSSDCGRL